MKDREKLAGNTILFSIATFLSRLLGLVREVVISTLFGLGKLTDAFFLAFTIPNLLRQLLAEGAFANAFIPVYSEIYIKKDKKREREFLSVVFTFLLSILIIISILGIVFAPFLIRIFAPGFVHDLSVFNEAVKLLRIIFPYILFISLTSFLYSILNTYGSFFFPALTPMWLNISIILFSLLLWRVYGIYVLAIGVIFGGIFQFLFLFIFIKQKHISFSISFNFKDPALLMILSLMIPAIISVIVNQLNIVMDRIFASFLNIGSISALYYANRLMQFPLGVFGIALSTVFFPLISKYISQDRKDEFERYISLAVRTGALILIPFSFYLFLFSVPIITFIYKHGVFSAQNVYMTAWALKYYSFGIFFYSGANFLNRVFYSIKDSKTPMYISIFSVTLNIVLDYLLMQIMSYRGLALATSLAGIFNFSLLFIFLFSKGYINKFKDYIISFMKIGITCAIITLISIFFIENFGFHFLYGFIIPSLLFFSLYFLVLYLLRSPELEFLVSSIKRGA